MWLNRPMKPTGPQPSFSPEVSPAGPNIPAPAFHPLDRRQFLAQAAIWTGGCTLCLHGRGIAAGAPASASLGLVSPGCWRSKVRVAKLYLGKPQAPWPKPTMDLAAERQRYEEYFAKAHSEFADVEFVLDELITDKSEVAKHKAALETVDGVLAIHLSMGMRETIEEILTCRRPMSLFAAPYSGHEWTRFGEVRQKENGSNLECFLTSDFGQLAVAVRPFRAIHHLREAKILNITARPPETDRVNAIAARFGTQVVPVDLARVLELYQAVDPQEAEAETRRWIRGAEKVVEPSRSDIFDSCRLALAFERLVRDEQATALTADCYGTMYRKLPAFPCVGFVRLSDLGLAGICESDLASAMTFLMLQGLSGRPGFISDPTLDESKGSIILAHCLGTRRMDGPSGKAAPYRLRTIMERQEGVVPQVRMRVGQTVTQALLVGTQKVLYFTGTIIEAPDTDRGCRTKITVQIDGDAEKLWQNWAHGLHRVTCYGDLRADLERFCRFKNLEMVHEA